MEKLFTVLLENGTVGTISSDSIGFQNIEDFMGEEMTVQLHDENGHNIEVSGILKEVL